MWNGAEWSYVTGSNVQPYLGLNYIIALQGTFPSRSRRADASGEPFLGEIRLFAGNFAPRGWAICDGTKLPISNYSALFSILGTTYGGNGRTNFKLPDLRRRVPVQAAGNGRYKLGREGGSEYVVPGPRPSLP